MASEQDIWELIIKTIGQEKLKEVETGLKNLNTEAAKTGEETEKTGKAATQSARGFLSLSQAAEDAQYGLAGVINNIPQAVMQFGGPAGLAAAISLTAVAAKVLYDQWGRITDLLQTKNPFPKMTGDLHELDAALKANNKELDELREKNALSNDELARANQLIKERAELEEQQKIEAEKKRIRETEGADVKARGEPFQAMVTQVGGKQAAADIAAAFSAKYGVKGEGATQAAEAMLANAIKGRPAARDEIEELLTGFGRKTKTGAALLGATEGIERLPGEIDPEERRRLQKRKDERAKEAEKVADAEKKATDKEIDAWAKEGEDFIAAQAKAKQKGFDVKQKLDAEANKPFLARETGIIKAGGMAEQAEAMLAQARAQGGAMGRRMTPDQQFAFVQRQAAQQLKQQFPKMGAQQRDDMATRVTAMGQKGLQDRMVTLQAQGVNAVDRTQVAMQQALMAVQAPANKQIQQGARADRLGREFQQTVNHVNQQGVGALNVGGP